MAAGRQLQKAIKLHFGSGAWDLGIVRIRADYHGRSCSIMGRCSNVGGTIVAGAGGCYEAESCDMWLCS